MDITGPCIFFTILGIGITILIMMLFSGRSLQKYLEKELEEEMLELKIRTIAIEICSEMLGEKNK